MASQPIPEAALRELEKTGIAMTTTLNRQGPPRVWRAIDRKNRDIVVRVVTLPEGAEGNRLLRRLADLRTLRHPGIVPLKEVLALPENRVALLSDFVTGVDLGVLLAARGRLASGELANLLDALGSAVAYLHENGLTHGDISPANVMVSPAGQPQLVDLVGSVLETGTAGYCAPERSAGGPATTASDVYSLARLIETAAGQAVALLKDALSPEPAQRPHARDLAARVPELGERTEIRFPDGAQLASGTLRAAASGGTRVVPKRRKVQARPRRTARRQEEKRRTPSRLLAGILALALLTAVAGIGTQLFEHSPAQASATASPSAFVESTNEPVSEQSLHDVVVELCAQRDTALNHNSAAELSVTTVEGSSAQLADTALLSQLEAAGEQVAQLSTRVISVEESRVPDELLQEYPQAQAVQVSLQQEASQRVGADGQVRTVPKQPKHSVTLVLVPDPWRVLAVKN